MLLVLFSSGLLSVYAQPTDNAIKTYYNGAEGYPAWTDEIKWDNVITMVDKVDPNLNFQEFETKRDLLYSQGGGVLYYPAGVYSFNMNIAANGRGLMLKKGVVIRGVAPSGDKKAVTTMDITPMTATDHGLNSLATKFVFNRISVPNIPEIIPSMWNCIGVMPGANETNIGQVSKIGVAWIEIEFGYIYFGVGASKWNSTWANDNTWTDSYIGQAKVVNTEWKTRVPDGSHPFDMWAGTYKWGLDTALVAEKRFVFGVHMRNSCVSNYAIDKPGYGVGNFYCTPYSFYWNGKISVYGSHVFVGNNVISKPTVCFNMVHYIKKLNGTASTTAKNMIFDYGNGIGIDCNKSAATGFYNRCDVDGDPKYTPLFYAPDVIVKDNFVYNHGNKGFELSGKWMIAQGNVNYKEYLGYKSVYPGVSDADCLQNGSDGACFTNESAADFQCRAFDLAGMCMWGDNNRFRGMGSLGNDGEGFLFQRHNGVEAFSAAFTNNENRALDNPSENTSYIAPYNVHCIGFMTAWNKTPGNVGFYVKAGDYIADASTLSNIGSLWVPDAAATVADFQQDCPTANTAGAPTIDSIIRDNTKKVIRIYYKDNTANEVGFRIERREVGLTPWHLLVYRPRQETGGNWTLTVNDATANYGPTPRSQCSATMNFNPQEWQDYMYNPSISYEYRVIAMTCDTAKATYEGIGAASPILPVIKNSPGSMINLISSPTSTSSLNIYPNPVAGESTIQFSVGVESEVNLSVLDMSGRLVKTLISNKKYSSGVFSQNIQSAGLNSGVYLIKLKAGNSITIEKFVVK